jgi:hypothetical protein
LSGKEKRGKRSHESGHHERAYPDARGGGADAP